MKMGWLARIAAGAMALAAGAAGAYTETSRGFNLPTGFTELSQEVYDLHMLIFWICVAIGVVVFGLMTYSIIYHRRSKGAKPANFHESTTVEIIWTIIPFVILVAMAIPAAGTLIKMEDTRNADMTVKITGYQWKWHYDYLGENVSFYSTLDAASNKARQVGSGIDVTTVPHYLVEVDNPLVLPVGKKVRFLLTANDVLHAWWVPELAVKKDAIPGFINETWVKIEKPGIYRGVCAELCGRDHGFMPVVVKALPENEYRAWLDQQRGGTAEVAAAPGASVTDAAPAPAPANAPATAEVAAAASAQTTGPAAAAAASAAAAPVAATAALSKDELMKKGEAVYKGQCAACHQAEGQGLPPNFPSLKGSKVANGAAAEHIALVLKGRNLMPGFAHLKDDEIAAVTTYVRQAWGNKGSLVQPADVATAR